MIDLQTYIKNKLLDTISAWSEDGIYAISFFVYSNEAFEYGGCSNVTEFSVSYNTESDCKSANDYSEKRWNYAFWRKNETPIIQAIDGNEGIRILFDLNERLEGMVRNLTVPSILLNFQTLPHWSGVTLKL